MNKVQKPLTQGSRAQKKVSPKKVNKVQKRKLVCFSAILNLNHLITTYARSASPQHYYFQQNEWIEKQYDGK
jgi:hypothetical protein